MLRGSLEQQRKTRGEVYGASSMSQLTICFLAERPSAKENASDHACARPLRRRIQPLPKGGLPSPRAPRWTGGHPFGTQQPVAGRPAGALSNGDSRLGGLIGMLMKCGHRMKLSIWLVCIAGDWLCCHGDQRAPITANRNCCCRESVSRSRLPAGSRTSLSRATFLG